MGELHILKNSYYLIVLATASRQTLNCTSGTDLRMKNLPWTPASQ